MSERLVRSHRRDLSSNQLVSKQLLGPAGLDLRSGSVTNHFLQDLVPQPGKAIVTNQHPVTV